MDNEIDSGLGKIKSTKKKAPTNGKGKKASKTSVQLVESIDEQLKFIRRFNSISGKFVPTKRVLSFIKSLQKAILEKRIRKSDKYAHDIDQIQKFLVRTYNDGIGSGKILLMIKKNAIEQLKKIAGTQKVRPSVAYLKRYIGLIDQPYPEVNAKIKRVLANLDYMIKRKMITPNDPYFKRVMQVKRSMQDALKNRDRITIPAATLNGLNGIIAEEESAAGFL